jgi:2-dehydropantoate 2-reductase
VLESKHGSRAADPRGLHTKIERVWVIGAGAVGSALAALLHQAGRAEPILVGAERHWQAVRDQGLRFEPDRAEPVTLPLRVAHRSDLPDLGSSDLVLLTGKLPGLANTMTLLRDRLGEDASLVALQNGFCVDKEVATVLARPVDRGLIHFGSRSAEPGQVHYYHGVVRLRRCDATAALCDLLQGTDLRCDLLDDFLPAEWHKLAINCLANPLAGLLGVGNATIAHSSLDPAKEAILDEVRAVAAAEGIELDLTVAKLNCYLGGASAANVPSLKTDLDRGLPTEIDLLNGVVVKMGRRHGVPTPVNELVVTLINFLSAPPVD